MVFDSSITPDEKERLKFLMAELAARGIKIPSSQLPKFQKWPTDDNGFCMKNDGTFFRPGEAQLNFVNSRARFVALISGRGGGKTCAGSQKALQKIMQGESGAVLNPNFENFKISTWPEFRSWIPWSMVVLPQRYRSNPDWQPHQPFTLSFINGVNVICKGVKEPDSARGPNINWIWYDEAGYDIEGLAWRVAIASVRVGEEPQAWITTTPRGFTWIYKLFVKQEIPQEALDLFKSQDRELVETFYTSIFENQDNLDPGFMASLLASYPAGWLKKQEVEGQFVEAGGVLGDSGWFSGKVIPEPPDVIHRRVRFWDLAATEKKMVKDDPDETVGTKMSWDGKDKFYIENQVGGFWEWEEIKKQIARTAELDGPHVRIFIEQEPASGGKNQVAEMRSYIREQLGSLFVVDGWRPEGDRVLAANTWFSEAAQGQIYIVHGNWVDGFFEQLNAFPTPRIHDDKITSVTGARYTIAPIRKWCNIEFMSV